MSPDPTRLLKLLGLTTPVIGLYDAPDHTAFTPVVTPTPQKRTCCFAFYPGWADGKTLLLTAENCGCLGAGRALCGLEPRAREDFLKFLVDGEGLKASRDLMGAWVDTTPVYRRTHPNVLIGPLRPSQDEYLRTVTFYANPDQLSALCIGAQYDSAPSDPPPVLAPFGAGCMQMICPFRDLSVAQAAIGATDIAMRPHLGADLLAFSMTKPMFARLCALDERSFLYKPFWKNLQRARGLA